jgi:hypothetical protein
MPIGDLTGSNGDQMGCLLFTQHGLAAAAALLPFVREHRLNSSGSKSFPGIANRLLCDTQCFGYLGIDAAFIAFQQDSRTGQVSRIRLAAFHKGLHMGSLVLAEMHCSRSSHQIISCFPSSSTLNQTNSSQALLDAGAVYRIRDYRPERQRGKMHSPIITWPGYTEKYSIAGLEHSHVFPIEFQ